QNWDGGSHCGESITITYNGKSVSAKIVDECMGCPSRGLDLTHGLFQEWASSPEQVGLIYGDWS
ncbi:hypothetical protein K488DRAFT_28446, partial [Vararia minispora EC-137]